MKPTIAIIDNSLGTTGAFNAIRYTALDLKDHFHFIFIIPSKSINDQVLLSDGFEINKLNMVEVSRNMVLNLLYFPLLLTNTVRLVGIIRKHRVAIVHNNDIYNLLGVLVKLFCSISLIIHVRRLKDSFPSFLFNFWMFINKIFADKLIAVSHAVAKQNDFKKTQMIYDRLRLDEMHEAISIREESKNIKIIYLANYTFGKGQQHAVEVLNIIVNQRSVDNIHLTFAGDDFDNLNNKQFKEELKQKVSAYHLEHFITLKERIVDVEKEFKQYDMALNFSESESFSYTCAEALFYGVPLVATDSGGPAELFEDSISGFLVPKNDYVLMADKIIRLTQESNLRKQFSRNSQVFVREKFSFDNTSMKIKKLYSELLE